MAQLLTFDYTSPYYYFVTLNAKKGLEPFSILTHETKRGIRPNETTDGMIAMIRWMNQKAYARRMKITNFVIMPNHLHLIIKIEACDKPVSLFEIVKKLYSTLSSIYYKTLNLPKGEVIFEERWHDWIVFQENTLVPFIDYVMNNPHRWLNRKEHAASCLPRRTRTPHMTWTSIGTLSLKETPVRAPVVCSRSIRQGSDLWKAWQRFAQRLGPGTLAVGTFMSPCEKMVCEEVLKAGGGIVHLIPRGISPKGHASAEDESLLIAGRLTILTPFEYEERTLTPMELHDRCHTTLRQIAYSFARGIDQVPPSR